MEEEKQRHEDRLRYLEEEFKEAYKAVAEDSKVLEEKKKTQQEGHATRMESINQTVAERTSPEVAVPIVQKAAEAAKVDAGVDVVKEHLIQDVEFDHTKLPPDIAELIAVSVSSLLLKQQQMMREQMTSSTKARGASSREEEKAETSGDEEEELNQLEKDGFTVMRIGGKSRMARTRDPDAIINDSVDRSGGAKRGGDMLERPVDENEPKPDTSRQQTEKEGEGAEP